MERPTSARINRGAGLPRLSRFYQHRWRRLCQVSQPARCRSWLTAALAAEAAR